MTQAYKRFYPSSPCSLNIRPKKTSISRSEKPSLHSGLPKYIATSPHPTKFFYDILCRMKAHAYTNVPHLVIPATRSHRHLVDWQPFSLAPLALVRHQLLLCSDMRKSPIGSLQWYKDMTCFQKPPYSGSLHCLCLRYGYIASITTVFLVIPLGAGYTR